MHATIMVVISDSGEWPEQDLSKTQASDSIVWEGSHPHGRSIALGGPKAGCTLDYLPLSTASAFLPHSPWRGSPTAMPYGTGVVFSLSSTKEGPGNLGSTQVYSCRDPLRESYIIHDYVE